MENFINDPHFHTVVLTYIGFQLFSALVQSLPTPAEWPQGGIWYKSFVNFLNVLIADFKSFAAKKGFPTTADSGTPTTSTSTSKGE